MKICKVWDAEYPWDVRVQKVARSLTEIGHDVHLVARNRNGAPVLEQMPEATVHRLRAFASMPRLSASSMFPAFFNPRWAAAIYRVAKMQQTDVILVRDLPLAPTAIAVGRLLKQPVVFDMAENYPAMTQSLYDNGVNQPFDWIVRNPRVVSLIERWTLRRADQVVVVVEESRDRAIRLGCAPARVHVVSNTPPLARLNAVSPREHNPGRLELIYLGILEAPRGLDVVLDAMAVCLQDAQDVHLTIVGDGRERARIVNQAERLKLGDAVTFTGYVPNTQALELVSGADVGLIPHQASESWNTTIPNKLFDYMAAGLAVISSDAKPCARIVRETQAGLVYHDTDAEDLARAIGQMANPQRRMEFGRNGRAAVLNRYHWEHDASIMEISLRAAVAARAIPVSSAAI